MSLTSATTSPQQVKADLGHDVARLKELKGSNVAMTKATLSAEHLQRVTTRFEKKNITIAAAGAAGAGAGGGARGLVFEVCLKELSNEELALSEAAGAAQAAALLTAKTKSSILMKRKTQELLTLYSHQGGGDVLFITDVNAGYVVGTEVLNPYRHPEAGGRGGGKTGSFNISSLNEKALSVNLLFLINNLLTGIECQTEQRMYCKYFILTKTQWEQLIAPDGKTPVTQILIQKLQELDIAERILTLPDEQRVLLQIYETIHPDDGNGILEYTNFTVCLSTGTLNNTLFSREAENQQWICCTLFTHANEGQCLVSFGGDSPRMANSIVNPFVDEVLEAPLKIDDDFRAISFIDDLESFVIVCTDSPESRLKLATAGASHKSGTDSNCRRFAREVVGDPLHRGRTIHITTGDGWFFKILSTQLNDMLGTIVGQGKKVILEYTPDKICDLYGYTEADSDRIQSICLGANEILRKNRIVAAVAKGKETRASNKISEAAAAAAAAAALPEARKALIIARAERIQRRNSAILTAAQAARAAVAAEPVAEPAAKPAAAEPEAAEEEAEEEAEKEAAREEDDEDADEDIYELLSLVSNNVVSYAASMLGSPVGSFSFRGYSQVYANNNGFSFHASQPTSAAGSAAGSAPPSAARLQRNETNGGGSGGDGGVGAAHAISRNRVERAIQTLRNETNGGGGGSGGDGGVGAAHAISRNRVERAIQILRNGVSPIKFPGNRRTRKHRPRKTRKRNRKQRKTRKV